MLHTNKQKKDKQHKKNEIRKADTDRFKRADELARQGYLTDFQKRLLFK